MRFFTASFIIASYCSFGQSSFKHTYQIIDAENAFFQNNKPLFRFDTPSSKGKIILRNGTLHLLHYTGLAFSFKGDTVIDLGKLNPKLNAGMPPLEARYKPNLKELFDTVDIRRGVIYDYRPLITFPAHQLEYLAHNIKDDLCIKWKSQKIENYRIEIKSPFDEVLLSYSVNTNSLTVPASDLKKLSAQQETFLIVLKADNNSSDEVIFRLISNSNISGIFQCEIKSPSHALMVGYYLEKALLPEQAEPYYFLAKSISNDRVFSEAWACFKKRNQALKN